MQRLFRKLRQVRKRRRFPAGAGDVAPQHPEGDGIGADLRSRTEQYLLKLVTHTLRRKSVAQLRLLLYRIERVRLYFKAEASRKAQRTEHTQSILVKAQRRIADTADNAVFDVRYAVIGVGHHAVRRQSDGVHGKISATEVAYEIGDEGDGVGSAMVTVIALRAEGRHLTAFAAHLDRHRAVL